MQSCRIRRNGSGRNFQYAISKLTTTNCTTIFQTGKVVSTG